MKQSIFVNRGQHLFLQNLFSSKGIFKYDALFCEAHTVSQCLQPCKKKKSNKNIHSEMHRQEGHTAAGVSRQLLQSSLR